MRVLSSEQMKCISGSIGTAGAIGMGASIGGATGGLIGAIGGGLIGGPVGAAGGAAVGSFVGGMVGGGTGATIQIATEGAGGSSSSSAGGNPTGLATFPGYPDKPYIPIYSVAPGNTGTSWRAGEPY